jgi:rubrerythrin
MRVDIDKNGVLAISDFAAAQAYKIAIRMEENGIAFYTDLLRLIKDDGVRRELTFLVGEEEAHRVTFLDFLNQEKEEGIDTFEEDDIVSYIHSKVFDVSAEKPAAEAIKGVRTSMAEALNMERRSILFYEGCLKNSRDSRAQSAFVKIIAEEKGHLARFSELMRARCINSSDGCVL